MHHRDSAGDRSRDPKDRRSSAARSVAKGYLRTIALWQVSKACDCAVELSCASRITQYDRVDLFAVHFLII